MKNLKILIALILFTFGTVTIIQISSEESGASFYGALTGYGIILLICGLLAYSAFNKKALEKVFSKSDDKGSQLNEQELKLKILRDKNILTEAEYNEKTNLLKNKMIFEGEEYKSLKSLYENGLFTKQEFDTKVQELINKKPISKSGDNNSRNREESLKAQYKADNDSRNREESLKAQYKADNDRFEKILKEIVIITTVGMIVTFILYALIGD